MRKNIYFKDSDLVDCFKALSRESGLSFSVLVCLAMRHYLRTVKKQQDKGDGSGKKGTLILVQLPLADGGGNVLVN